MPAGVTAAAPGEFTSSSTGSVEASLLLWSRPPKMRVKGLKDVVLDAVISDGVVAPFLAYSNSLNFLTQPVYRTHLYVVCERAEHTPTHKQRVLPFVGHTRTASVKACLLIKSTTNLGTHENMLTKTAVNMANHRQREWQLWAESTRIDSHKHNYKRTTQILRTQLHTFH